jgi:hypothetical protein
MEKRIISFKGISNVPDDGLNEAGDMSVLLNMRHKGGELVPCQPPAEVLKNIGSVEQALYHANSKYWLFLRADGSLKAYKEDFGNAANPVVICGEGVKSFAIMGNIVIINFADRVEYAIWRNGGFEYLGGLPEVPRMRCDLSFKTVKTELAKYYGGIREAETAGYSNLWEGYNKKGELDVCLSNLYDSGAYIDFANFRLALKLFDGTYKVISPIYLVNGTRKTSTDKDTTGGLDNFRWQSNTNYTSENEYWAEVEGFIPSFKLEEYDFENWSDIVSSVCLFTSGSLPMHGVKKGVPEYMLEQLLSNDYEDYLPLTAEEFKENLLYANYYKVAEYDLKGKLIDSVRNTSPSNLAQQDILILKDLNDYASSSQICINSRLHIYEFKTLFPHGFADIWAYGGNNDDVDKIVVKTFIKTENGNTETIAECTNCKTAISSLLTYPNRDAYKMDVYVKKATKLTGLSERQFNLYYKSFELTKDNAFAYYINPECWQINSIEITSDLDYNVEVANANWILDKFGAGTLNVVYDENGFWTINGTREVATAFFKLGKPKAGDSFTVKISKNNPVAFWDYLKLDMESATAGNTEFKDAQLQWVNIGDSAYKTVKDFTVHKTKDAVDVIIKNVLKVSAVDNPFYFPTAQTYKFEGNIVGLASNAEAISPGQFGMFPLYVFTDTGIWAMQVDTSGQGAYTTQSPSSREVCSGAICPVSGGVVFATDKGVMAISNGQVADLSAVLDGFEVDFFEENAGMWEDIFAKAGKDDVVNPVPIREYIQGESGNVKGESGAKLAYNYLHNEVILSNVNYGYSYVYSLTNQVWSVIDVVFDLTTNKYPELVVFDKGGGCMYTFKDGAALNKVVAITRPFTLGSIDFKRIRQAGLRTTFNGRLNFYVLGSIDGAVFKCITGKEVDADVANPNGGTYRDLITAMSRSKQYKYFAIAIAGNMSGRVSVAELLVDAGFANNKIR